MEEYKIQRKVLLPKVRPIKETPEYIALKKLNVNESFEFNANIVWRVRACIVKEKHRGLGKQFATRNLGNGKFRVWRTK